MENFAGKNDYATTVLFTYKLMTNEYNASSIKIKDFTTDIWSMAISLSEKFNHDIKLIERGLIACELAGAPFSYYIDKYLRKLDIPINHDVNTIYREQQKINSNK